jgi:hypothetical protein
MHILISTKSKQMNNQPESTSYQRERLAVIKLAVISNILQHITVL